MSLTTSLMSESATDVALAESLRRAEARYRLMVEQAPVGVAAADRDGRFLSVNARFCSILGYEADEIIGRRFTEFSHPDDVARTFDAHRRVGDGLHGATRYDRRYIRKDGSVAWVQVALAPIRDEHGEIEEIVGFVEDITAQKAAREKVLTQARLLDCVLQAVVATDVDGHVTYWNRYAEKLYGWSEAEALGRSVLSLTPSEAEYEEAEKLLARLRQGESWSGEMMLQRKDGSIFPAWVIDSPILDDAGQLIGFVGVSHDLTDVRRAEDELRQHRVQLADAQDIAHLGSWTYDYRTGARQWSDGMLKLTGLRKTAATEQLFALVHPDDRERMLKLQDETLRTFDPVTTDVRITTPQGERTLSLRARIVKNDRGEAVQALCVVQDVTAAKAAEDELRRRATLQSAVANLGQLALSGACVGFVLEQTAGSLRNVLDVDLSEILQINETGFQLVAGSGWDDGEIGINKPGDAALSQASFTIASAMPVIVQDIAAEDRFTPSELLVRKGITSGLTVAISSGDGTPWGVLGVHTRRRRSFTAYEIDFLRSLATVLGQAIDRAAADAEVRARARQQSAIASLGRLLLDSVDTEVLDHACELLRIGIGADYAFFRELTDRNTLLPRAGTFWHDPPPGEMPVRANAQAGYTILSGEPVLVDDYRTETRFDTYRVTVPYGILSGVTVPIASATRTFGILSAQSRTVGQFRAEDVDFLRSLANMLAEAMEREAARGAVIESEHRHRRIFDGASEIIFTVDRNARFVALNPAFTTLTGWDVKDWLGRPFDEIIVPEDRERLFGVFTEMLQTHESASAETTLLGNGRQVLIQVQSFPKVENGDVAEVYGFARDITDERRAMAERERVTRSLELLLESTVEGIYTVDLDGRCTMVNRAAAAFLGLAPQEMLGRKVHELLHPSKPDGTPLLEDECAVHGVLRSGEARTITNDVFRRKDGAMIPVAYSAAPIVDGSERVGAVVTFTDLTERRKLEMKLEQANRLTSLGRLAATIAHEFNNVLMGVAPFVEVLRRGANPQKTATALDHITTSVKRGRRITQDILRFTQPAEPVRSSVDVQPWLRSVATEARTLLPQQIELVVEAQPLSVEADANQLHQIFTNLIFNARDAMPRGGTIRVEARRERSDAKFEFGVVERPARYAHFVVRDTGSGMSEDILRHIFEPLFTTKKNGTGLGLPVTHQVVQRHGGEIFVESTEGVGTTFHIFLPLSEAAGETPEAAGEAPLHRAARRILVVEDNPVVAAGLHELLENEGFAVIGAASGNAALATLRQIVPDAVILDVGLPDMDGQTVYAGIAKLHPTLPVIFSTGHAERGQLEELLVHPHVQYLLKPYESEALMNALARVIAVPR